MSESTFDGLPEEIRKQIDFLTKDAIEREKYAVAWKLKYELFTAQIQNVGMICVESLEPTDARGAILLTWSGSLISLYPAAKGKFRLEYASVKFRDDVPDFVHASDVTRANAIEQDKSALFENCLLTQSSAVYRIAVCGEGTKSGEQEQIIREASIYLTNGFVKINKTLSILKGIDLEQFSQKSMINYVAKKNNVTQTVARSIIDDYLSTAESGALMGERVSIGKLGTISLKLQKPKKARVMKNISTGSDIVVPAKPARYGPKFSFSKSLKEKSSLVAAKEE